MEYSNSALKALVYMKKKNPLNFLDWHFVDSILNIFLLFLFQLWYVSWIGITFLQAILSYEFGKRAKICQRTLKAGQKEEKVNSCS